MKYLTKAFWAIWNFWFKLPDKIRFLLVGGFNASVQYLIYACLLYFWSEEKQEWIYTKGVRATMPMYEAEKAMRDNVTKIAREVFG